MSPEPRLGPIPDLRRWLQSYALWSGGGRANVAKMLRRGLGGERRFEESDEGLMLWMDEIHFAPPFRNPGMMIHL